METHSPTESDELRTENAWLRERERIACREAREAARSKEDMIDILADELRNPLDAVVLSLHRMKARAHGRPDPLCDRLGRQVDRLTALVDELVDASQVCADCSSIEPRPVEVHELV